MPPHSQTWAGLEVVLVEVEAGVEQKIDRRRRQR
jgi:hypothetical protein